MLAQATTDGPTTGTLIAIAIVIIVLIAIAAIAVRMRSRRLRERFGPEYDRTVEQAGSRERAETELEKRERRHRELDIRPLAPAVRSRYVDEWRVIQDRFVDDPSSAVNDADRVIVAVMRDRGYPVDDPVQRVNDLSVEHAAVIDNYRSARAIAARNARREASTEELRRATVSYRTLFEDLTR